jgi:hypothetical protein
LKILEAPIFPYKRLFRDLKSGKAVLLY